VAQKHAEKSVSKTKPAEDTIDENPPTLETSGSIDDILDEIDDVLEENAQDFVNSYVQQGGE
jgi:ubiquitin-like protein Pup